MLTNARVPGLLPTFIEAYQHLLDTSTEEITVEQMYILVLTHYDLKLLFESILSLQPGSPFHGCAFISYFFYLPPPFNTKEYFFSIAVPIYRERKLKVFSEKRKKHAPKDNEEDLPILEQVVSLSMKE